MDEDRDGQGPEADPGNVTGESQKGQSELAPFEKDGGLEATPPGDTERQLPAAAGEENAAAFYDFVPEEPPAGRTPPPPLFRSENRLSLDDEGHVATGEGPEAGRTPPLFERGLEGSDAVESVLGGGGGGSLDNVFPELDINPGGGDFDLDSDGFNPGDEHGGRRDQPRRDREERQPRGHEDRPFRQREERQPRRDRNRPEPTADGGVVTGTPLWLNRGFLIAAACLVLAIALVFGWSRHKEAASDDKSKAQVTEVAKAVKDEPAKKATEAAATKEEVEGAQIVDLPVNAKVVLNPHGKLTFVGGTNVRWDEVVFQAIADGPGSEVNQSVEDLMSAHGRAIGVSGLNPARANGLVSNTLDRVGNSLDRTAQAMEQLVNVTKVVADANVANAKANQTNADANQANSEKLDDVVGVLREGFSGLGVKMTLPKE